MKSLGLSNVEVGLVSAIPNFLGAVAMILSARSSDRTGKRVQHVTATCLLGALAMAASSLAHDGIFIMIGLTVALIGAFGFLATFWALPSTFLTGRAAAGGFGLILSIGNSSGFFGPYLVGWLKQTTPGYSGSLLALSGFLLLAATLTMIFGRSVRSPRESVPVSPSPGLTGK